MRLTSSIIGPPSVSCVRLRKRSRVVESVAVTTWDLRTHPMSAVLRPLVSNESTATCAPPKDTSTCFTGTARSGLPASA